MIRSSLALVLLASSTAVAGDLEGGNAPEGTRVVGLGGTGVAMVYQAVAGADGGNQAMTLRGRVQIEDVRLIAELPFATYRVASGNDVDLGNVALGAFYDLPYLSFDNALGVRLHFGVGENAWGWINEPDELWPGAGIDVLWQGSVVDGPLSLVVQGSVGVHGAQAYAPFPRSWLRAGVSTLLDASIGDRFGAVGELSLQYWDTTPIELSAMGRADLVEGLRLRAGLLAPVATWAGLTPAGRPGGIREITLLADLSLSL